MTTDFDDVRPHTWADTFPWLADASVSTAQGPTPEGLTVEGLTPDSPTAQALPWCREAIEDTDPATRDARVNAISNLAMEHLTRWKIGQIFPHLNHKADMRSLNLSTEAKNALNQANFKTARQLIEITVADMLAWRNIDVSAVEAILKALVSLSISHATPDDITTAGQPLNSLTNSDVLTAEELELDIAAKFNEVLSLFDAREVDVAKSRLFADEPVTLEKLGQNYGVTRERIRQVEARARGKLLAVITDTGPLANIAEAVRKVIGTILPLDTLLELIPALRRQVDLVQQPAWRILDRLDDVYEIEDGWCVVPTMIAAKKLTRTHLRKQANLYGLIPLNDIELIKANEAARPSEISTPWLIKCGYRIKDNFVLTRTSSVGDYAAAILAIEGAPLSAQEIVERFAVERNVGSIRNKMSTDDRLERVDRDRWALSEWGLDPYDGIRSVLREQVSRGGGSALLDDVVKYITAKYSVSETSVSAYAAAWPFMTRKGIVRMDNGKRVAAKTPEDSKRLFRREHSWVYRVRVTTEHLRGSGSVAPMAIATLLNLHPGEAVQLKSPLGPQSVTWTGIQPLFGTIRKFLMNDSVPANTEVFLIVQDDRRFTFERARALINNPLADALSLIGAPPIFERDHARIALARAILLPSDSTFTSIIDAYSARGDEDIATILLASSK